VYVAFLLEAGLLLIVLPWSGFWRQNYFAQTWPALRVLLENDYLKGAVSGLGLVDLVGGFADLALIFAARARPETHPVTDVNDLHNAR
jgi:hypothetical protein